MPVQSLFAVAASAAALLAASASAAAPQQDRFGGLSDVGGKLCQMLQVGIFGDTTTAVAGGEIYYKIGSSPWKKSSIEHVGHSVARMPNGKWIANDTAGNRVIEFDDISGAGRRVVYSQIANVNLSGPHDQIVDLNSGYVYLIDGNRRLFRFKDLEGPAEVWTFTPEQMGYDRSLSWFDGHLHVIDSSRGEVLRIDNYSKHRFTRFRSPRPTSLPRNPEPSFGYGGQSYGDHDFMGGSLSVTGLILNDVDKVGDWYYATNEFTREFAMGGDPRPARLIRWKSWVDFESGKWEDLSAYLGDSRSLFSAYFITVDGSVLYAPMFSTVTGARCPESRILRLDTSSLPK